MSLLGLDVGTTGCKAVLFDDRGRPLASTYREYPLIQPREGWVELDPEIIWESVKTVLRSAVAQCPSDPVAALAVASQGETTTAIDRAGRPLHNFIVTFDNRTEAQVSHWTKGMGRDRLFAITGMPLHPMYSINKMMWMLHNVPGLSSAVEKFLLVEDFTIHRLTGEYAIDHTLASRTMAFDVRAKQWSSMVLSNAGIGEELLSPVYSSGTPVGTIRKTLAGELNLRSETVVVTGGHDQPCGALGAGVSESDVAMNATGTVDALCPVFHGLADRSGMLERNFAYYPFVIPNYYCTIGFNLTGGLFLRWYRDLFAGEEVREAARTGADVYDLILSQASEEPKDLYVLPYLVGSGTPSLDPLSKAAIVGLRLSTTRQDIIRGILDGVNLDMRNNIQCMRDTGIQVREIRAVGGGARSARWLQLKADCFGVPVKKPLVSEAVSLGAAILAGTAIGYFANVEEAVEAMVAVEEEFEPNPESSSLYQEKFEKYRELMRIMTPYNRMLE